MVSTFIAFRPLHFPVPFTSTKYPLWGGSGRASARRQGRDISEIKYIEEEEFRLLLISRDTHFFYTSLDFCIYHRFHAFNRSKFTYEALLMVREYKTKHKTLVIAKKWRKHHRKFGTRIYIYAEPMEHKIALSPEIIGKERTVRY